MLEAGRLVAGWWFLIGPPCRAPSPGLLWRDMERRPHEFLARIRDLACDKLGQEAAIFQARIRFSLLQFYRQDPRIHYEVWLQRKTGRIEIGLHFEGEREDNYRWAETLSRRMVEIQAQLGPSMELEEWTRSWTRLHETLPLGVLAEETAQDVAARLVRLIRVMEPILAQEAQAIAAG